MDLCEEPNDVNAAVPSARERVLWLLGLTETDERITSRIVTVWRRSYVHHDSRRGHNAPVGCAGHCPGTKKPHRHLTG